MHQDTAVYRRHQIAPPQPLGQTVSQSGGGDIHQPRQGNGGNLSSKAFRQILPLWGKDRLSVLFRASKGADARQIHDLLRLPPQVEAQEHIRSHQQPQLGIRIFLL